MEKQKLISLNENDLLRLEQIVIDRDKDGALEFVREVVKRQVDRENASKMKRKGYKVKHEKKVRRNQKDCQGWLR